MGGSSATLDVVSNSVVDIEINTLDGMSTSLGKIDVMKIDVEGMEFDVLQGAVETIFKDHPVICLEQDASQFTNDFNETAALDFLRSLDYRLFAHKTSKYSPWLVRRLKNIFELFFGGTMLREIIKYDKLPKKTYPMIFAIHSTNL